MTRFSAGIVMLLLLPYSLAASEVGIAEVFSSFFVDERKTGCSGLHLGTDLLYLSTETSNSKASAWKQIAADRNLIERYKVLTGDVIRVHYKDSTPPTNGTRRLLQTPTPTPAPEVESIDVVAADEGFEVYTGTQIRIRSTIVVLTMCGWPAAVTLDEAKGMYFTNSMSVSGYHDTCSYGKVTYDPADSVVLGPVEVPCTGTVRSGDTEYPYDSSTGCGPAEQYAWRQGAEAAARAAGYGGLMDATPRRRVVVILPNNVQCMWAGLGAVGCGGPSCVAFIKGTFSRALRVHMHELAHTQGFGHAARGDDEYGDTSDVMGTAPSSDGYLCMNVANQHKMGWSTPLATLHPNNTNRVVGNTGVPGRWIVRPPSASDAGYLHLQYGDAGGDAMNYFISFRTRTAKYDNILGLLNNNRVFIHSYNGTASRRDYNRTNLLAVLRSGDNYTSPMLGASNNPSTLGGVRVTVLNVSSGSGATVQLCRFTQLVESGAGCSDGLDNDSSNSPTSITSSAITHTALSAAAVTAAANARAAITAAAISHTSLSAAALATATIRPAPVASSSHAASPSTTSTSSSSSSATATTPTVLTHPPRKATRSIPEPTISTSTSSKQSPTAIVTPPP